MNGLESKILEFIENRYKICFNGKIKVDIDGDEYCLKISFINSLTPTWICSIHPDEESFLEYIKKEIVRRKLINTKYFKLKFENGEIR